MEDVIAVEVRLHTGQRRYFLTWGRVQDAADPAGVEALVLEHAARLSLSGAAVGARVCPTLQAAAGEPYFYECLFTMGQKRHPFGPGYDGWRRETAAAMRLGREIYFLGAPVLGTPHRPDA